MRSRPYARHSILFLFWWLRWCCIPYSSRRYVCVQSTEANTLISVVRHLTFIDFIKWSKNGSHQTQFSHHQYVTTVSVSQILHCSPLITHNDNNNSWHFIGRVVFCACFFRLLYWWIIVSLKNVQCTSSSWKWKAQREKTSHQNRLLLFVCFAFYQMTHTHHDWMAVFVAFSVQKFMAKMIYLNVFTAILHLLLCVCVVFINFSNFLRCSIGLRICFAGTVDYSYW